MYIYIYSKREVEFLGSLRCILLIGALGNKYVEFKEMTLLFPSRNSPMTICFMTPSLGEVHPCSNCTERYQVVANLEFRMDQDCSDIGGLYSQTNPKTLPPPGYGIEPMFNMSSSGGERKGAFPGYTGPRVRQPQVGAQSQRKGKSWCVYGTFVFAIF